MSVVIINKNKLASSKLELFTDVIYNNFIELQNVKELSHDKQTIYETLKCNDAQVYLILVNKKIASYMVGKLMTLNDGRRVVYITYLYTAQQFRKHGYASKLLKLAFKISSTNMLDGVMLTCDSENQSVYNFYINNGFMPDVFLRTYGKYEVMYKM